MENDSWNEQGQSILSVKMYIQVFNGKCSWMDVADFHAIIIGG